MSKLLRSILVTTLLLAGAASSASAQDNRGDEYDRYDDESGSTAAARAFWDQFGR